MINESTINQYLQNLLKEDCQIEQIVGLGDVNEVYKIGTAECDYVLKVNKSEVIDNFLKEKWCLEQTGNIDIPVPKVIDVSTYQDASFCLLSFIDGMNSSKLTDINIQNLLFTKLGKYSQQLITISHIESIGDLKSKEEAPKWFYEDYLGYEIRQTSSEDDYLVIPKENRQLLLDSLELIKNTKFEFVLCHGDISLTNCMYDSLNDIVYLIDFGCAETQPKNYFEIMLKWLDLKYEKLITQTNFDRFLKGLIGDEADAWLKDNIKIIEAFALVYSLDKYRWAHDKSSEAFEGDYLKRLLKLSDSLTRSGIS
ncbi:aminoglycoside phosphotransferase family protein [Candidatus Dojkabacteria bacterium]|nr:aminoglycoside phosphotransferase family protein [Candidatus Dojkabacteria bacterium]